MKPRATLPNVSDEPRSAFTNGWVSGIAVGIVLGAPLWIYLAKRFACTA